MSHSLAEYGLTAYISVSQTVVRGPLVLRTQVVCNTTASAPMRQYYIRSILAQITWEPLAYIIHRHHDLQSLIKAQCGRSNATER